MLSSRQKASMQLLGWALPGLLVEMELQVRPLSQISPTTNSNSTLLSTRLVSNARPATGRHRGSTWECGMHSRCSRSSRQGCDRVQLRCERCVV